MQNKEIRISSIMTKKLITANVNDSLLHANTLMRENHIRHLPVVTDGKLIEIISRSDILRLSFGDMFEGHGELDSTVLDLLEINEVMNSSPLVVHADETVREVSEKFLNVKFHAFPVVRDKRLVGIVSTTDVIRFFLQHPANNLFV